MKKEVNLLTEVCGKQDNDLGDPFPVVWLFLIVVGLVLISIIFEWLQLKNHKHLYIHLCKMGMIAPLIGIGMVLESAISSSLLFSAMGIVSYGKTAEWSLYAAVFILVVIVYFGCAKIVKLLQQRLNSKGLSETLTTSKHRIKEGSLLSENMLQFSKKTAREIMIPRTEMICLNTEWSIHENIKTASIEMRTRYPVCAGDKDHIIGFVHIKELFMTGIEDYTALIRPILSVPESTSIDYLLKQMKETKTQISIIIDEYGGTSGLVTLEDIVEEIVGEIQDEFDNDRPLVEYLGDNMYSVDGLMLIEELKSHFDLCLEDSLYDTIGGWLFSELESFPPQKGDSIIIGNDKYAVEEVDHLRISRIILTKEQTAVYKEIL